MQLVAIPNHAAALIVWAAIKRLRQPPAHPVGVAINGREREVSGHDRRVGSCCAYPRPPVATSRQQGLTLSRQ
eukprot:6197988-Pleurochrysis_carterae.AAC.5